MSRKKRSDSVLAHLPLEQQRELSSWLFGGMSYEAAALELMSRFGVKSSSGAVWDFWHSFCAPELRRRRAAAVNTAAEIISDAEAMPGRWDEAALESLRIHAMDLAQRPGEDSKQALAVLKLILQARSQELEARKVSLLERKAAQADQAEAITGNQELTPEEKDRRLRNLWGMG